MEQFRTPVHEPEKLSFREQGVGARLRISVSSVFCLLADEQ